MAYDYYAAATELAGQLEALGHAKWAMGIKDAMRYGSTGTEILMTLQRELERIAGECIDCPEEVRTGIRDLLRRIRKAL
jgi:hypothetical protein